MKEEHKIKIHEKVPITIEILSPLHIGDGTHLIADYDFLVDHGTAYIFDGAEVCIKKMETNPQLELGKTLDHYLRPDEFARSARYSYPVTSRPKEIYCQIKSGDKAYIPGSSLKGSIRTALLAGMIREQKVDISKLEWEHNKRFAASPIERRFLGYNPNEDIFKGLFVRDSEPCQPGELLAAQVFCYHVRKDEMYEMGQGFRWTVEAFPVGMKISSELVIDLYALDSPNNSALFDRYRQDTIKKTKERSIWLVKHLFKTASIAVTELISREKEFFEQHNMDDVARFYNGLLSNSNDHSNTLLLPLGWGTGWQSKTLGMLDLDKKIIDNIVRKYRLGRFGGNEFPMTRRLWANKNNSHYPLGWILLSVRKD